MDVPTLNSQTILLRRQVVGNPEQYSEQCRCSNCVCDETVDSELSSFTFFYILYFRLVYFSFKKYLVT